MFEKGLMILSVYCFCSFILIVTPMSYTNVTMQIIDHNVVEKLDLTLVQHNGKQKFNGAFQFKVELKAEENEVSLEFERAPKMWIRFIHLKVDFCKFLENKYLSNRYLLILLKDFKQTSGLPQSCPIQAHRIYKMEHFDTNLGLPKQFPNISFTVKLKAYTKGHLIFKIIIDGFTKSNLEEE